MPDRLLSASRDRRRSDGPSATLGALTGTRPARPGGSGAAASRVKPVAIDAARPAPLPRGFQPQLATTATTAPDGNDWLHEIKYDGYRLLCFLDHGEVTLMTRRGNDWTSRFAPVAAAVAALPFEQALIDAELVALQPDGTTSFQALQNHMRRRQRKSLTLFAFDLMHCDGHDLTAATLLDRKALLRSRLDGDERAVVHFSEHIQGRGPDVFALACRASLEGIIAKRADGPYIQRRTRSWLKIKCLHRQEFVVVGFTDPSGSRHGFGALLLAVREGDGYRYCGRVGTGFDDVALTDLRARLDTLRRDAPPVSNPPGRHRRTTHWVQPRLVAEVAFTELTDDGVLRHPSFQGLREDKDPQQVVRERPLAQPDDVGDDIDRDQPEHEDTANEDTTNDDDAHTGEKHAAAHRNRRASSKRSTKKHTMSATLTADDVRMTNPDRVLYPEQGITKRELADYYVTIAEWVLPHVADRPLSVVRCPKGRTGECFFQKHVNNMPEQINAVRITEKKQTRNYLSVKDIAGVVALVQMGVLEIHPWGSRVDHLEQPDRLIFDLDPGPGVGWPRLVNAARTLRDMLEMIDLASFVRTTGGKGLHVVVPLTPRAGWDDVKQFSRGVAQQLAQSEPKNYVAVMTKAKRDDRIFVDYLRNGRGATAIASYSTRARSGAPVATPLRWDELGRIDNAAHYTVANVPRRMAALKNDPWDGFDDARQALTESRRREMKE